MDGHVPPSNSTSGNYQETPRRALQDLTNTTRRFAARPAAPRVSCAGGATNTEGQKGFPEPGAAVVHEEKNEQVECHSVDLCGPDHGEHEASSSEPDASMNEINLSGSSVQCSSEFFERTASGIWSSLPHFAVPDFSAGRPPRSQSEESDIEDLPIDEPLKPVPLDD
ncbi:hypothetical protein V5799_010494 [Amblyomma americanum]|uniref:Uncharacterized protein n=1 Tax=Amblyomma americanum TaxID=6943 RepID=A0AAQ4EKJ5_AMBAM